MDEGFLVLAKGLVLSKAFHLNLTGIQIDLQMGSYVQDLGGTAFEAFSL